MPFENLYNEPTKDTRRRRTTVLIFFGLAVYFIAAGVYYFHYHTTENKKRMIADFRIKSVENFCREIQYNIRLPLVARDEPVLDDETATVVYRHHSLLRSAEIKQQYLPVAEIRFGDWLNQTGWQPTNEYGSTYRKGNQTFSFYESENIADTYEIRCSETQSPVGFD